MGYLVHQLRGISPTGLLLAWLRGWTRYRLEFLKREVEEAQALESLVEVR